MIFYYSPNVQLTYLVFTKIITSASIFEINTKALNILRSTMHTTHIFHFYIIYITIFNYTILIIYLLILKFKRNKFILNV